MADLERPAWTGRLVRLRAIEPGDWEAFWLNDGDTVAQRLSWHVPFPRSAERAREWARSVALADLDGSEHVRLALEAVASHALVGSIVATHLDRRNGTFEYGLAVFADEQRKGYGAEAILLLLRYFFEELRFQKALGRVYAFNDASLALHRRLGFVEEGRVRRVIFAQGAFHDEVLFGMTTEEFAASHGASPEGVAPTPA